MLSIFNLLPTSVCVKVSFPSSASASYILSVSAINVTKQYVSAISHVINPNVFATVVSLNIRNSALINALSTNQKHSFVLPVRQTSVHNTEILGAISKTIFVLPLNKVLRH